MDRRRTILIVEDDIATSQILNIWLRGLYKVLGACDGEETLRIVEEEVKAGRVIDLFLFDICLPYPWSGISLKHAIIKKWPIYAYRPFLAETAFVMPPDREEIMKAGFSECLTKPLERGKVIKSIEKLL